MTAISVDKARKPGKVDNNKMPPWLVEILRQGGPVAVICVVGYLFIAPMREDMRGVSNQLQTHNNRTDIHDDREDKIALIDLRILKAINTAVEKLKEGIPPPIVNKRLDALEDNQKEFRQTLAEILRRVK